MNNKFGEIINYYGVDNQQRKLAEEVQELQEAITEYEVTDRYDTFGFRRLENRKHIAEECADVIVLVRQIIAYYDINTEDVKNVMRFKVDRQLKRIGLHERTECTDEDNELH